MNELRAAKDLPIPIHLIPDPPGARHQPELGGGGGGGATPSLGVLVLPLRMLIQPVRQQQRRASLEVEEHVLVRYGPLLAPHGRRVVQSAWRPGRTEQRPRNLLLAIASSYARLRPLARRSPSPPSSHGIYPPRETARRDPRVFSHVVA